MKNILFFQFLLMSFVTTLSSQSVVINVCPGGNCNNSVDPDIALSYTATPTLGANDTLINYDWSCVGASSGCSGNSATTSVSWLNTTNTGNAHNLIVYMNYRNKGIKRVASPQLNVTVKHIAPITSMSLSGATSATVNSSGQTVPLPCSTNPLTITVPTPVTDPAQPVTYTWTNPSGWGGSSTTNSIVVTPPATGDANISVSAKRTDGTVIQSFNVNLSRSSFEVGSPIITTSNLDLMCNGDTRIYTVSAANATNFTWTSTPSNAMNVPTSNSSSVNVQALTNSNGGASLGITVSNACGKSASTSRDIAIGPPVINFMAVNGSPVSLLTSVTFGCNSALATVGIAFGAVQNSQSYSWQKIGGNGSYYPNYGGWGATLYAYNDAAFRVTASNLCGTGSQATFVRYNTCSGYYRMASPNPTQGTISVEMDKALGQEALISVKLISHGRNTVERSFTAEDARRTNHFNSSDKVDFDVSNLPRGTYYLMIDFKEDKKFKETIILN